MLIRLISFYGEYVNIRLDIFEMVPDNHRNSSVPQMSGCGTKHSPRIGQFLG